MFYPIRSEQVCRLAVSGLPHSRFSWSKHWIPRTVLCLCLLFITTFSYMLPGLSEIKRDKTTPLFVQLPATLGTLRGLKKNHWKQDSTGWHNHAISQTVQQNCKIFVIKYCELRLSASCQPRPSHDLD